MPGRISDVQPGEPRGRQPPQRHPEEQDEHDAEPEVRQRLAEHGERHARDVVARAAAHRGEDAEGDADGHGDEHGHERELDGRGQALEHDGEGGGAVLEGLAEVAAHHAPEKEAVLHDERLAQPELTVEGLDGGLGGALGQEHPRGVAGEDAEDHEDEDGHAEQRQRRLGEPPEDVDLHRASPRRRAAAGMRRRAGRGPGRLRDGDVTQQDVVVAARLEVAQAGR